MKIKTPDIIYPELFQAFHESGIWDDGKMISDAEPNFEPSIILENYKQSKDQDNFDLEYFFKTHFTTSKTDSGFSSNPNLNAEEHCKELWSILKRQPKTSKEGSSLIDLPYPYLVPGGRFNEMYYWDSYFSMLGMKVHGEHDLIRSMIENFAWLIHTVGFIPNGNRSYFTGRSQPPFFALMVILLSTIDGEEVFIKYLKALELEYAFWMRGESILSKQITAKHRVVKIDDHVMNRYFDDRHLPREEMYQDDIELMHKSGREAAELFPHVRAACESGWDFSSRWFMDLSNLKTIQCADIIPVDLNCLLYSLEDVLFKAYTNSGDLAKAVKMEKAKNRRFKLINTINWCPQNRSYCDFNFKTSKPTDSRNLACVYPLFFGIASEDQAMETASVIEKLFLSNGGLRTTNLSSGQQWDAPNGWAPLQWMTVVGLRNYKFHELANEICRAKS